MGKLAAHGMHQVADNFGRTLVSLLARGAASPGATFRRHVLMLMSVVPHQICILATWVRADQHLAQHANMNCLTHASVRMLLALVNSKTVLPLLVPRMGPPASPGT